MRLEGKVAVVTGAGSGIGRATAVLFAAEGASVVCLDWNAETNAETVAEISAAGGDAVAVTADHAVEAEVARAVTLCEERWGRVDVLFNNAGKVTWATLEDTSLADWEEMIRINLTGPYICSRLFLPLLKASGRGSVIHNGSVDGLLGNPKVVAYSAAKGGLTPLTHVMAHEFGKHGIRVNCIAPGGIKTNIAPQVAGGRSPVARYAPLGRQGTADEIATCALHFASDESSYTTGAIIVIDGGRTGLTQGTID